MLVIRQTVSDGTECEPDLSEAKSSSYHMTQPREVNSEKTLWSHARDTAFQNGGLRKEHPALADRSQSFS